MPRAMRPVTDWFARMFRIFAPVRNVPPVAGSVLNTTTMMSSAKGTAARSTKRRTLADRWVAVLVVGLSVLARSTIVRSFLEVDQLVETVGGQLAIGDMCGEPAVVQDDGSVDHLSEFFQVGRDDEGGTTGPRHFTDGRPDVRSCSDVNALGRFVQEQQDGLTPQPATDDYLLLIAAGKAVDGNRTRRRTHPESCPERLGVATHSAYSESESPPVSAEDADIEVVVDAAVAEHGLVGAVLRYQHDSCADRLVGPSEVAGPSLDSDLAGCLG